MSDLIFTLIFAFATGTLLAFIFHEPEQEERKEKEKRKKSEPDYSQSAIIFHEPEQEERKEKEKRKKSEPDYSQSAINDDDILVPILANGNHKNEYLQISESERKRLKRKLNLKYKSDEELFAEVEQVIKKFEL